MGLVIAAPAIVLIIQTAREATLIIEWMREVRHTGLGTPDWVRQLPFLGGYLAPWWQDHLAGRRNWQGHLWNVLMFQAWLRHQTVPVAV